MAKEDGGALFLKDGVLGNSCGLDKMVARGTLRSARVTANRVMVVASIWTDEQQFGLGGFPTKEGRKRMEAKIFKLSV